MQDKQSSGITTDSADTAMQEAPRKSEGPKIPKLWCSLLISFSHSKNTKFEVTRCGFRGARML